MNNTRENAGYVITDSVHIGDAEFVIGQNKAEPPMYVTWQCKNGDNYFWGHYITERKAAEKDLLERAGRELELQSGQRLKLTKQKRYER